MLITALQVFEAIPVRKPINFYSLAIALGISCPILRMLLSRLELINAVTIDLDEQQIEQVRRIDVRNSKFSLIFGQIKAIPPVSEGDGRKKLQQNKKAIGG